VVSGQMLSHPDQVGLQPLCTQVIEALAYHLERLLHFKSIGATSLPGSSLASQVAAMSRVRLLRCGPVTACISSSSRLRSGRVAPR
jgi:hypothetical protein